MKHALLFCVISLSASFAGDTSDLRAETSLQCPAPGEVKNEAAPASKCDQAFEPKEGLAWMMQSAEFKALAEATFAAAAHRLEKIVRQRKPGAAPWVVVVDADDTILDNMQFQLEGAMCGVGFTMPRWEKWVARREAGAVPGAAGFLARVAVLGGKVAVVTNRLDDDDTATAENMRKLGMSTDPERVCLLGIPDCVNTPPYGNKKDERFAELRTGQAVACWKDQDAAVARSWAQPQDIVMYIGDNVQDFPGMTQAAAAAQPEAVAEHLGHDWFLIPNAEYGSWEKKRKSWIKRLVSDQVTGWANLSGLAADPDDSDIIYAVTDKDAGPRILTIDVSKSVPEIVHAVALDKATCGKNLDFDKGLDLEGIATSGADAFWVVSEGEKSEGEKKDGRENRLLKVAKESGECLPVHPPHEETSVGLPADEREKFVKRGFEGVTVDENGIVYVALQSPLNDEKRTRIAKFDPDQYDPADEKKAWSYYYYELDKLKDGREIGLNELLYLGGRRFAVIERDNEKACLAKLKSIHTFMLPPEDGSHQLVKDEGIDLIEYFKRGGTPVAKQVEGLAITPDERVYVVTDNDKGEDTRLLYLGDATDKDLKLTPGAEPKPEAQSEAP